MAWEALNNIAAARDRPLIIVVNDNERSYAPTIGGLANHLATLRTTDGYERNASNPAGGSIINISSAVTSITPPNASVYTATKGAVDAITRTLAKELGPRKIRVNAILPGMIETEGVKSAGMNEGSIPPGDRGPDPARPHRSADDIAPAAVFLASPEAAYITGETLRIAGGLR